MKVKTALSILFLLTSTIAFGQKKEIRIGPGPSPHRPEPVMILDGIKIPPSLASDILLDEQYEENIDSVSIQPDSVFDCHGELLHLGIVKIYTKDAINLGAKKILVLTDEWLHRHPLSKLIINNRRRKWDEKTYAELISLQPNDIVYAKVKKKKNEDCEATLKLKIKK